MRWMGKIWLTLMAFSVSLTVSAATERTAFARIKVEARMELPPVTSASRTPSANPRVSTTQKWLVLKVTYHPQIPRDEGPNRSTFLDGVRMSVAAEFPLGTNSRGGNICGLFKGGQTFWTVCCDGRQHVAMMFIPPHLLNRYMYALESYTAVHTPAKGNFKVEVVFTDRGGKELGRGYYGVSGTAAKQQAYFRRLEQQVAPEFVIDGAFMERGETPWRVMEPDQFDLLKPAGLKLPETPAPPRAGVTLRGPRRKGGPPRDK